MEDNSTAMEIQATEMAPAGLTCMDPLLYNAAFKGDIEAVQQGVEPLQQLLTPNKNTVLHIHFTAETGKVFDDFVEHIINLCPSIVLQANAKGETPLHIAARYGHFAAANILIERSRIIHEDLESEVTADKKLVGATSVVGDSALHEAVRYKHIEVVELLIGRDPDYPYNANKDGETPLYIAVERKYKDIVFEILEKCSSTAYGGPNGRTALHSAAIHGDGEMVRALLQKEPLKSSIEEADKMGWLPLHLAARAGHAGVTRLLLEQDRKTAYMRDNKGRTALHLAAMAPTPEFVIDVIISYCPDCAEIVDSEVRNPLHYAASNTNGSIAVFLGETSLSNLYNEKDENGNTPLHLFPSIEYPPSEVPKLIKHQRVDKLAFNRDNLTAVDVCSDQLIIDSKNPSKELKVEQLKKIRKSLVENGALDMKDQRIKTPTKKKDDNDDDHRNKDNGNTNKNEEDEDQILKKATESHLVVATLIATVTFAAGFTLPGGVIQEGQHQGTPILKHNAAFQAFVVSDTIAMVCSATAVFIHMLLAVTIGEYTKSDFLQTAFYLTIVAMASMIIAFVTGTFAMLHISSGLGFAVILIGLSFFIPCVLSLKKFCSTQTRQASKSGQIGIQQRQPRCCGCLL